MVDDDEDRWLGRLKSANDDIWETATCELSTSGGRHHEPVWVDVQGDHLALQAAS